MMILVFYSDNFQKRAHFIYYAVVSCRDGCKASINSFCTQWIPDNAPGTLIKIDDPHQFAPLKNDAKELKQKFHEVLHYLIVLF